MNFSFHKQSSKIFKKCFVGTYILVFKLLFKHLSVKMMLLITVIRPAYFFKSSITFSLCFYESQYRILVDIQLNSFPSYKLSQTSNNLSTGLMLYGNKDFDTSLLICNLNLIRTLIVSSRPLLPPESVC